MNELVLAGSKLTKNVAGLVTDGLRPDVVHGRTVRPS
jgi:hypothetical protein